MRRTLLATALLLCACKGAAPGPAAADAAPPVAGRRLAVEWRGPKFYSVDLTNAWNGGVEMDGGAYRATLLGFPVGTTWTAGARRGSVTDPLETKLEVAPAGELDLSSLAAAPLTGLGDSRVAPRAPLLLVLPGGDEINLELPPLELGASVAGVLAAVERGPLPFGAEPAGARPLTNIVYVDGGSWSTLGPVKVGGDIDAIAILRRPAEVKGTKECTGYQEQGQVGPGHRMLTLELKDAEVTVYERRTGRKLDQRVFSPPAPGAAVCPTSAFAPARDARQDSAPPDTEIRAWIAGLLRAARAR